MLYLERVRVWPDGWEWLEDDLQKLRTGTPSSFLSDTISLCIKILDLESVPKRVHSDSLARKKFLNITKKWPNLLKAATW